MPAAARAFWDDDSFRTLISRNPQLAGLGGADDAFSEHPAVDVLHIDLSNDGDTYRNLFSRWATKVTCSIVLEGGSLRRDRVPWMQNYKKPQIDTAVAELRSAYDDWSFSVVEPFPSITLALRR